PILTIHIILGQTIWLIVELTIYGQIHLIYNLFSHMILIIVKLALLVIILFFFLPGHFLMLIANPLVCILVLVEEYLTTNLCQQTSGQNFSECITQLFLQHNIPLSVNTHENIDTTWHKIQHSILQAAIQLIPNKISRKRSYNHKYTPHCTAFYTGLKKLGQLIKKIKNNPNSYLPHINSHILSINSYTKANLDPLLSLDTASTQSWLQHAYEVWKQVYHAYQLEYSLLLRQQINHASEKRCETLTSKPKQAINSILDRYQPPIHFLNIKLNNQLVTEPSLIKQHIKSHYHNWTAHRPINQYLFDNFWHQHYQPLSHINSAWYTSLTVP